MSTPHRAFEAIKAESEITGRFKHVSVPSWTEKDLESIAEAGFSALNISFPKICASLLATESQGSPLLMQRFCWSICYDINITETKANRVAINSVNSDALFREVAMDAGLPIFERLSKGPQSRTDRIRRPLAQGGDADIYEAILLAIARTGPKERLSYDAIRASLNNILRDKIPQKNEVSNALNQLTEIDKKVNAGNRAIDWDPDGLDLVITDPFFRFYLRWKVSSDSTENRR